MRDDRLPDPLPEAWLPEPVGEATEEAAWEERVSRIVAAAGPRLRRLARDDREAGSTERVLPSTWLPVGGWWRPAAALAAAAALTLLFTLPEPPEATTRGGSPALGAVVSEGEPVSLWEAGGSRAHPVLALIALEEASP